MHTTHSFPASSPSPSPIPFSPKGVPAVQCSIPKISCSSYETLSTQIFCFVTDVTNALSDPGSANATLENVVCAWLVAVSADPVGAAGSKTLTGSVSAVPSTAVEAGTTHSSLTISACVGLVKESSEESAPVRFSARYFLSVSASSLETETLAGLPEPGEFFDPTRLDLPAVRQRQTTALSWGVSRDKERGKVTRQVGVENEPHEQTARGFGVGKQD
eukprot:CAMPEP_0197127274 /NCGR_PEP_ID=MMETSP1390-20130617/11680_1 /TAXON_ID=38833 /ORGANISM="Micromonas sp., Strain CCMP2099" /LENGTH=216 /DNA_ID=CAMNT_0042569543 /DNA_START=223 /DNA_END=872 /DNA_ORIENTATION=+